MPRRTHLALTILALTAMTLVAPPVVAQGTPSAMAQAYESLADTILAVRAAEAGFVKALLDGHERAAEALMRQGDYQGAAAQMALFANEGDNAVGGVRKRLLEGGHHFNASGEEAGVYEPGYVIVDREAKAALLAASSALRQAADDAARHAAWEAFATVADPLVAP